MTRRIVVARPVALSQSTIAPASRTSPVDTSNECGTKLTAVASTRIDAPAEDAVVRAAHADIALERGAAGHDLLVGGGDVRVRAQHGRDAALEVVGHQVLVGGGLGVHVHEDDLHVRRECGEDAIGGGEGAIDRPHVGAAEKRDDGDARAIRRRDDGVVLAGGDGREVGGLDDRLGGFGQKIGDVELLVDVIAERDGIDPGGSRCRYWPG